MMSAKKNVTLRAAAVLFALALITSCFVGGTFAKYVTNGTGSDKARVAKFGVTVEANGTMFAEKYDTDKDAKTVVSSRVGVAEGKKDNVVAPGTSGKMVSMKLSGQPEVDVHVNYAPTATPRAGVPKPVEVLMKSGFTYAPTVTLSDNWKDKDNNFYCPLQIKVNGIMIDGHRFTDKQQFVDEIVKAIVNHQKNNVVYKAGTDLSTDTVGDNALTISWAWPFETATSDDPTPETAAAEKAANNVKDTYLGDQAANNNAATIEISVVTTVTQVD